MKRRDAFHRHGAANHGVGNGVARDVIRLDCAPALRALLGMVAPGLRITVELARLVRRDALDHGVSMIVRGHRKFPLAARHALSSPQAGDATAQHTEQDQRRKVLESRGVDHVAAYAQESQCLQPAVYNAQILVLACPITVAGSGRCGSRVRIRRLDAQVPVAPSPSFFLVVV